jgi:hypothetical protein
MIGERFMNPEHAALWTLVDSVEEVLDTIRSTPLWDAQARRLAVAKMPAG